ncbi:hypothetical protein RRG08_036954 [Elysia crispata]|uniref:VWFA domain-containing protein n=1 Tax=Elysia crispata TaxID=231223 RepID=A0AAE1D7E8_9GAST|nr:hypothetical protein RRG08_036954 [Elysia crispata]
MSWCDHCRCQAGGPQELCTGFYCRFRAGETSSTEGTFHRNSSVLGSITVAMLRVLLLCVSLMAGCCAAQTACSGDQVADIFFLLDESGSVTAENFKLVLTAVKDIASSFPIGPSKVKIGVATFSTYVGTVIPLKAHDNQQDLLDAIDKIQYRGGYTYTNLALQLARTSGFADVSGGRDSAPDYLIVITDGKSTDASKTQTEAAALRQTNITVLAVGVGSGVDIQELNTIASSPSLVFNVSNFQALSNITDQLVTDVCPTPVQSSWSNWGNWAPCSKTCGGGVQYRYRTCTGGEKTCQGSSRERRPCSENPCSTACSGDQVADIFFLLDESGSVSDENFKLVLTAVKDIASSFPIGPSKVRIGVATFSTNLGTVIPLKAHDNQQDLLDAIDKIQYRGGYTYTNLALQLARTSGFTDVSGGRDSAPDYLIVITDGKSTDASKTQTEAAALRQTNITVLAVGVGSGVDIQELNTIASSPSLVFNVSNFQALSNITDQVVTDVCPTPVQSSWSNWGNWAPCSKTCGGGVQYRYRTCTGGEKTCQGSSRERRPCSENPCSTACSGDQVADIFFLLDESGSVSDENFKLVLTAVKDIASSFPIGPSKVRIGVATFSTNLGTVIPLKAHDNQQDLLDAIDKIQYRGGYTYTNLALRLARTSGFTDVSGGRDSAPDYLIVITDGKSTDASKTQTEAAALRQTNITVLAVGVGSGVDIQELNTIASSPSLVFNVSNFQALSNITDQLVTDVCPTPVQSSWSNWGNWAPCSKTCGGGVQYRYRTCTGGEKTCQACSGDQVADIFFLLDESGSVTAENFKLVLTAVKDIASSFPIGPSKVKIGVATFSTYVGTVIPLKAHDNQQDLLDAIDKIQYRGGYTYTNLALQLARTSGFTDVSGGRDSAPDYLIVITDGKSTDASKTQTEAAALRQTNITVLAVGVGSGVDIQELNTIASSPSLVFNVSNFQALSNITDQLVTDVCPSPINDSRACKEKPCKSVVPDSTTCQLRENIASGDIRSVTISCKANNVYPEAGCKFYRKTNGGKRVAIKARPSYTHKLIQSSSGSSYRTECSVREEVSDLGEGTHTFHVFVYPNVTGGESLVNATMLDKNVTLSFPRATHNCPPTLVQDYLCGKPTACNCTLISEGRPKGYPLWFHEGTTPIFGPLVVSYDISRPNIAHTCEGTSGLGRILGSTLKITTDTTCG